MAGQLPNITIHQSLPQRAFSYATPLRGLVMVSVRRNSAEAYALETVVATHN
jgi:hypothetical protein